MSDGASTWVDVPAGSDFGLGNLPLGIATSAWWDGPRVVVAIGDHAVDCHAAQLAGLLGDVDLPAGSFAVASLNSLLAGGHGTTGAVRRSVYRLLTGEPPARAADVVVPQRDLTLKMPVEVGDYVDFYASEHHARNLGRILRPSEEPLAPNWHHIPVGYDGRAGSVVVSGTDVIRPHGMVPGDDGVPAYGPTRRLDFELEVAAVVGLPSRRGRTIPAAHAAEHLAGFVLLNDWSARDVQGYESRPLGPHLGKSFATSISPWLVVADALEPFRAPGLGQDPAPAAHLVAPEPKGFAITLEVAVSTRAMRGAGCPPVTLATSDLANLYWSHAQQLAHLTSGGAPIRAGDLLGSGTVSGPTRESAGSLMELAWGGTEPVRLPNGELRTFLEDGDQVTMRGWAGTGAARVGFGALTGTVVQGPN